ncbi:MAG: ribosomal L7Ae/L30e/S12e/Gadd45 family protein [Clostridia bacterium]|nr:ribosomal L7Ae/L30e/S12e/Gadd45 family protein [Clostridia bacterium]
MSDKLKGMLGLAMRAGKLIIGTEQVCLAMAKGRVMLLVVSAEASDQTKKKLRNKCEFYGVKMITPDIEIGELGRMLGKTYAPACVGVTDENFTRAVLKLAEDT